MLAILIICSGSSEFEFAVPKWHMMLSIILCDYLPSVYLHWWGVCSDFLSIFKLGYYPFIIEWQELFLYSGFQSLITYVICKYSLLFRRLSFDGNICITKVSFVCSDGFVFILTVCRQNMQGQKQKRRGSRKSQERRGACGEALPQSPGWREEGRKGIEEKGHL